MDQSIHTSNPAPPPRTDQKSEEDDGIHRRSFLKCMAWVGTGLLWAFQGGIQILQKVEGSVTFHTARSTAFPQPVPGTAPGPGPIKNVPADHLRSLLGLTSISYVQSRSTLAVVDSTLA